MFSSRVLEVSDDLAAVVDPGGIGANSSGDIDGGDADLDAEGRANVELRLKLVMAHARYRGWLVDRKQVCCSK